MNSLNKLIEIGKRKITIDKTNDWSQGSKTYLNEIIKEVNEVQYELDNNRNCHLEDELGDVLWDYINALLNLEIERGIELNSIIDRACNKYEERVSALENGISWNEIKQQQKNKLIEEEKLINH